MERLENARYATRTFSRAMSWAAWNACAYSTARAFEDGGRGRELEVVPHHILIESIDEAFGARIKEH